MSAPKIPEMFLRALKRKQPSSAIASGDGAGKMARRDAVTADEGENVAPEVGSAFFACILVLFACEA